MTTFTGTSGDDNITGTSGDDTFDMRQAGNDTVQGAAGNDLFLFGGFLTAADSIDGGAGADVLRLAGDYSAGLTLGATTLVNVETIQLNAGDSYNITTNDANVAAGTTMKVDAHTLGAGDSLTFNGTAESDGKFQITGGAGNDNLTGGANKDIFILTSGGIDFANGRDGDDLFQMGATFTAAEQINGGSGNDTVQLAGDYTGTHAVVFNSTSMTNVETLQLAAGNSYNLTTNDATVATGTTMTIDASALGAGDVLTFNGGAESNGYFDVIGGAGNDVITGGNASGITTGDTYDLSHGGNDTVTGGTGFNTFLMGAALTAADTLDGGTGTSGDNIIVLNGDYSGANAVTLSASTITNFVEFQFDDGHDYSITENNGNVASGKSMEVLATGVSAGHTVIFNGAAETNGFFNFFGGHGTDVFTGGAKSDSFVGIGGTDTFNGGGGTDTFLITGLIAADKIDGGTGNDVLTIRGSTEIVFTATTATNLHEITFQQNSDVGGGPDTFDITTNDATVAAGVTLEVNGRNAPVNGVLTFNGSAETDGHFSFFNSGGIDTLTGGALSDTFNMLMPDSYTVTGGGGADLFEAINPNNHHVVEAFDYNAVSDSTSANYDTITGANFVNTVFHTSGIGGATTGVDTAVTTGSLSTATFDSDLATDVGAGQLAAHHAVLFTANAGTLSGQTFLVIDENGTAGYQAGADLVIDITGAVGTLSTSDFS
jgi:RTX calcium-binding nonapeptide repeat (4 copies)